MSSTARTRLRVSTLKALFGLVLLFGLSLSTKSEAFPELTRHGYTSCTSCHVSPNGGGVLTPYGRNLSRELLSTWGNPREAEVLHGALPEEWMKGLEESKVRIGGDARWIQTRKENSASKSGAFFLMQENIEAAWDAGPWVVDLSVGKIEDPMGKKEFRLVGSRYFGMYRMGENAAIRVGRFGTAFGLNLADHTLSVRRPLGLEPEFDRDNVELSWISEKNQYFASFMKSADANGETDREQAVALRYDRVINENSRVGASFWQGEGGTAASDSKFKRFMVALHTIVNISHQVYVMGEIDRQERRDAPSTGGKLTQSQYGFLRLYYEPVQGIVPLLQYQHERGDIALDSTEANKYGLGASWFPRPHFEFFGIWNRVRKQSEWSDEAYLMLHYYL
jgi:hypothetical protein